MSNTATKTYRNLNTIIGVLTRSRPGTRIELKYTRKRGAVQTDRARAEAQDAKDAGFDLTVYTGVLETFVASPFKTLLTMKVKERVTDGGYAFRSFNLRLGRVAYLKA